MEPVPQSRVPARCLQFVDDYRFNDTLNRYYPAG